jgi:hypothetical protein
MKYQKINNITGWVVFGIALITYWLTFEETGSYWDCGEFIAVAYKLEVSHPPGAPLFMLLGRLFSFLAFGDVTKVAYWINFLSVLASAFTILLLFWSITLFGRKMMGITGTTPVDAEKTWVLMGAGIVGSLAYTFSDSFWFSAVEAEVYAMSSFFTAFVVWGILKWDVIEDEKSANRWLVFIAYMVGLSIGVHLLNLLTLPALGLIYYFKKYKPSQWGIVATLAISGGLILFINDLIIPGLPTIAGMFEVFFINTLGLPFGSGVIIFCILLIAALVWGIRFSQLRNRPTLNTFFLSMTFILIGYCSYTTIVIRSNFETSINENAPKDVMSFVRYLKREQYGSRPLLYGPYFTARPVDIEYGDPVYVKGKDKYEISEKKFTYVYEPGQQTILPRAWNAEHDADYRAIMGLPEGQKPTFGQNLQFMFTQQIGTMYMRYIMWNFAGRESDIQGADWLSPLHWFEKLPHELAINRGRNNFFMIPFVLGLVGMFYQFTKDTRNFAVVALLFVMLGVAIVVYLNSPPTEPRERDYIYAGSTYAFTFWIGLAVIGLAELLKPVLRNLKTAAVVATLIGLTAPAIMAYEGWDDHNRHNRFFSVDSAKNYLDSCAPNAILFTGGDNDTFPLWYAQEVEGYRTDVRVVVLSYYNTDWYIGQTMEQAYGSAPFPYTLSLQQYRQGGPNDYLRYEDLKLKSIDLRQYIDLLSKDLPQLRNGDANIVPSKIFVLDVNKQDIMAKGIVPPTMDSLIVPQMVLHLQGGALEKKDLAFLDVLVSNNWQRPIYVNNTSKAQFNFNLDDFAVLEGNAYRILPIKRPRGEKDFVNTKVAYDNMINKFHYRELNNPKVYYNEDYRGFILNQRASLNSLAEGLVMEANAAKGVEKISVEGPPENKMEEARKVLLFSLEKMPDNAVPYDLTATTAVDLLFRVGEKEKAIAMATVVGNRADEMVGYLVRNGSGLSNEVRKNMFILGNLYQTLYENGENDLGKKMELAYEKYLNELQVKGPRR